MSKFLEIIENATPGDVDMVKTLFNKNIVKNVEGFKEQDIIALTLTDNTRVRLKLLNVTGGEEEEDTPVPGVGSVPSKLLTAKDREVLKATTELGVDATRRTFGIGNPVTNLGKAVGDFYNKLATRLKNISSKMSV